jgi:UrcA family protein
MTLRLPLALAAALMLTPAVAPSVAYASPVNADKFEATVAHDDLDLTTSEGVSRLEKRVRARVRQVCETRGRDVASYLLERECRVTALAATAPAVRGAIAQARAESLRFAERAPDSASPATTPGA